ncbi:DUF2637 domain-containing protein [Paractinoplanes toevensis]|uniref:DUF2637 domain-containing protein n=1 Tax=Paractinoplanes toevensis TaxID=571911 RepID=A0A919WDG6_9ACTN|nr:DUF2637 domain-containing protein [Actinoplanes toevensis]GIM98240.1 hypothetical protein Ato02nite_100330 [Actinoplanes toevensis]
MTTTGQSTGTAAHPAPETATPAPENPHTTRTAVGDNLRRVRWGVRAALTVGVAASVAANILHAQPQLISQIIAAWPPLALLLTVELISRVPVHRRALAAVRLLATTAIAGIAAWVSYFHMAGVVARYGETGTVPYLLPLSVDGLVIVASISLVELAGRIHNSEKPAAPDPPPAHPSNPPDDVPAEPARQAPLGNDDEAATRFARPSRPSQPPPTDGQERPNKRRNGHLTGADLPGTTVDGSPAPPPMPTEPRTADADSAMDTSRPPPPTGAGVSAASPTAFSEPRGRRSPPIDHGTGAEVVSRTHEDMPATAAAIADLLRSEPSLQPEDVAAKINRSIRTVRRHWKTAAQAQPATHEPPSRGRDTTAIPHQVD